MNILLWLAPSFCLHQEPGSAGARQHHGVHHERAVSAPARIRQRAHPPQALDSPAPDRGRFLQSGLKIEQAANDRHRARRIPGLSTLTTQAQRLRTFTNRWSGRLRTTHLVTRTRVLIVFVFLFHDSGCIASVSLGRGHTNQQCSATTFLANVDVCSLCIIFLEIQNLHNIEMSLFDGCEGMLKRLCASQQGRCATESFFRNTMWYFNCKCLCNNYVVFCCTSCMKGGYEILRTWHGKEGAT